MAHYTRLTLLLTIALSGCGKDPAPKPESSSEPTAQTIAEHNRGVGLMGRFEYADAAKVFEKLAEKHPDWHDVRVDWAIAVLNRQEEGDTARALDLLSQVLKSKPDHPRALYCRGLLLSYEGKSDEARADFERVLAADPRDAYATYFLGQIAFSQSRHDEAEKLFKRAAEIDPYLRSAYYGLAQLLLRTGKSDDAQKQLAVFQRMADNPQSRLAELKYTRMGPKAEVVAYRSPVASEARPNEAGGDVPIKPEPLKVSFWPDEKPPVEPKAIKGAQRTITTCDINGDGRLDLFVTSSLWESPAPSNSVYLRAEPAADDSAPSFFLKFSHPLATVSDVNAVLWSDYDNDGLVDAYFCRRGPNQLWRQVKKDEWADVTSITKTDNGNHHTVAGRFVDADHDGDLDLLLANADGPSDLLSNNRDGTFRSLGKEIGFADDARPARGLLAADLDRDRDLDLIVVRNESPHTVLINDRLWNYGRAKELAELEASAMTGIVAADSDADGQTELYSATPTGVTRWTRDSESRWKHQPLFTATGVGQLAIDDLDGDMALDLLVGLPDKLNIRPLSGGPDRVIFGVSPTWLPVMLNQAAPPALVDVAADRILRRWPLTSRSSNFLALVLTGKENKADQMRTNASGLGARIAVRAGTRWTMRNTLPATSAAGQSLQPLSIGLGDAKQADFVQIWWPDGVFQTELALAAGQKHTIAETQRQLSSCPVVFVWNGRRYEFVTDVLGVGGIGFNVARGEYPPPRPWENLLLPPDIAQPRDGRYHVKLSEPMEEVCYLDAARLVAYDLPLGWNVVIDERFAASDPQPAGKPLFFRRELTPTKAINDRGENVTREIGERDAVAAPPGRLDPRFIGRTAPHELTLEFAEPLDREAGELVLIADSWIEYPYSQTMFAAWQAGATYDAPTLSARGADGQWQVVCEKFGYPAGMPRTMALPIPRQRLPHGTTALRLATNLEIYWDRVAVAACEDCPDVKRKSLPLQAARLAETGFARRTTFSQRRPHYDYSRRSPTWDAAHPAGWYTAIGPVEELVRATDDALAIFGPGEEIHLEFDATPTQTGTSRRLVLELDGWCKDRDLFTQHGETVAPLPRRNSQASQAAETLMKRFNTRYRGGH